jgi:hypothetical protein
MKRIVRLTESDLTRIVRRVVNESRLLNEGYPYDVLKSNPTPAVIAKALKDAYGGLGNDCEACIVAALQAIKPGQANINAVSQALAKINGGMQLNQWIASFNEGGDLTDDVHNGTSIMAQIARIYGYKDKEIGKAGEGGITYISAESQLPSSITGFYNLDKSFKDELKAARQAFSRPGFSPN